MSINAIISADHDYGENLLGLNLLERFHPFPSSCGDIKNQRGLSGRSGS